MIHLVPAREEEDRRSSELEPPDEEQEDKYLRVLQTPGPRISGFEGYSRAVHDPIKPRLKGLLTQFQMTPHL